LESALRVLIRFHKKHPDWFPALTDGSGNHAPAKTEPPEKMPSHGQETVKF